MAEENQKSAAKRKRKRGAQPGNENSIQHGAYSIKLSPEEEEIYQHKRELFLSELGKVNPFDAQVVHVLSLISAKLDVAAVAGAPAEALIPIINEILKLLRSLKETRDSRDPEELETAKTAADFLEELAALDGERGISGQEEESRKRIHELERGPQRVDEPGHRHDGRG